MAVSAAPLFALTPVQQGYVTPRAYMNASIRLYGDLSVKLLRGAFAFILERHAGLRMRVVKDGNKSCQRIAACAECVPPPLIPVENFEQARERLSACLRSAADLERDGPLHAELLQLNPRDHILVLAIHAIAIDAHALGLLLRELLTVYAASVRGETPSLPPCLTYEEHLWSHSRGGEKLSEVQMQHWRSVLSGSVPPIASDLADGGAETGAARAAVASLTSMEAKRVHAFASAVGVSMPTALYTAIFIGLLTQFEREDLSATVTYSGRDSPALLTLCAKTARLFPMRVTASPHLTLEQFAKNVQSAFMRGVMASRPPFTTQRAQAQLGESAGRTSHGVHLVIADNPLPERKLDLPLADSSAERVLMGPQPYEGIEADESAPFQDALVLLLMRDPSLESRRPVVFSATFLSHVVSERGVRRLLDRVWSIARMISADNRTTTLGQLVSQTRQLYNARAVR